MHDDHDFDLPPAGVSRRDLFRMGNALAVPALFGAATARTAEAAAGPLKPGPGIYQSIGVEPVKQFIDLQKAVQKELEHLNFEPEERAYHPHVTIGRTQADGKVDREAVDRMTSMVQYKARVSVESVDLMRSHLGRDGARYERIHAARLRG